MSEGFSPEQREFLDTVVTTRSRSDIFPNVKKVIIDDKLYEIRSRLENELKAKQAEKVEDTVDLYAFFADLGKGQMAEKAAKALDQKLRIECCEIRARIGHFERFVADMKLPPSFT